MTSIVNRIPLYFRARSYTSDLCLLSLFGNHCKVSSVGLINGVKFGVSFCESLLVLIFAV